MKTPTPEQMTIAVCQWVGWKHIPSISPLDNRTPIDIYKTPEGKLVAKLPYLTNDLNAIALMEARLTQEQETLYVRELQEVVFLEGSNKGAWWLMLHATATQRLTALTRVVAPELWR